MGLSRILGTRTARKGRSGVIARFVWRRGEGRIRRLEKSWFFSPELLEFSHFSHR